MIALALVVTLAQAGGATQTKIPLALTVTNDGKAAVRFCVYGTPFEGVRNEFMSVTDTTGKDIRYVGIMMKRAPPSAKDYKTIEPGASDRAAFDLREGYTLVPGHYTVRFTGGGGLPASAPIQLDVK